MEKEDFIKQDTGRYRLVKPVVGGDDCPEAYENGWKDKSMYMFLRSQQKGSFFESSHPVAEMKHIIFDPVEMKYYLKADYGDEGFRSQSVMAYSRRIQQII